jgi:hypothetical protein
LRHLTSLILVITIVCLAVGCGGGSGNGGGGATPTPTPVTTPTPTPSPSPIPTPSSVAVSVSPQTMTVPAGQPQSFTATVTGTNNTAVSWQVNGIPGGNALFGTIDSTGTYHSPTAPTEFPVSVTAVSQADTTKSGTAHVTIIFDQASLIGDYVFLVTVGDTNPLQPALPGFSFAAGTFHADGQGNITAGIEDLNSRDSGAVTNLSFTGTYTVSATGSGTATITSSLGTIPLRFVLTSSDRGQVIEFDSVVAASGFVSRRDSTAIANVTGNYVFSLFGDDAGGPIAIIGRLTSDGAGNLTGSELLNDNGATSGFVSLTGTYTMGAGGRGTATVTNALNVTQHFVFYIVNATTVQFIDVDNATLPRTAGTAFLQSGTGSLGSSAFIVNGMFVSGGRLTAVGRFDTNGAGVITGGKADAFGTLTVIANSDVGGNYTENADGTGTISVFNQNFHYWKFSPTQAVVLMDGTIPANQSAVGTGLIVAQQGAPFTATQFNGNYDFGTSLVSGQAALGQFSSDGVGAFTGTEDVSNPSAAVLASGVSISAQWSMALTGRGSGTLTTNLGTSTGFVFYPVTPNQVIFATTSDGAVGIAEKQCSDCH